MSTKWDDQFAPVLAQGREVREGQRILGNAIIDVVEKGGNLIAECATGTGKSFGTMIPVIVAIQKAKKSGKTYRGVVSTETLTLQDQIYKIDLPFLLGLYPGFTYTKLMGRSNYLCLNAADDNKIGVRTLNSLVETLKARLTNLGDGEKSDVERVIGRKLTDDEWSKITGSSSFCGDNQCTLELCFSAKARKKAKECDIVVANHSVLAVDLEIKQNALPESASEDGLLGDFEALVVDEGHRLAPVLVDAWSKELTQWEISAASSAMTAGIEFATEKTYPHMTMGAIAEAASEDLTDSFSSIQKFYAMLAEKDNQKWNGYTTAVCLKYLTGKPPAFLLHAMKDYEEETPVRLAHVEESLTKVIEYLSKAKRKADLEKIPKRKKLNKGLRSAGQLLECVRILSQAISTKNGIISQYGIYGVTVQGWEKKKDGSQGMTLRMRPMDVSTRAQYLFHNKTNILVSATLTDLTDGTFKYVKASTGFPTAKEVRVDTPFSLAERQLFYMTPATGQRVDHLRGAQFSFAELVSVIEATRGRSLVLFTSREELDYASSEMLNLQAQGQFNYPILIQEQNADKAALMEEFKSVTDSVLFATKSFFVGIDVPGEALSGVWLCKWPNPQYNAECKQEVEYWRGRGFKDWYTRESLTTFQQAAGRLIRSLNCKGVVGILDFRVSDRNESVFKSALIGVKAIGSPVTIDVKDIENFFATT